jgi:uncharacterized membrane protein
MPKIMFKVMMIPISYQKRKRMMQKQFRLNSLLLSAVNQSPLGMMWQVVPLLKRAKTWEVLLKPGELPQIVVSCMDRGVYRGMTRLEN